MTTTRPDPPRFAGEREMLRGWLEFHRATLAFKCDGLDDGQLRERSVPSSTLTLLSLVRHLAEVERTWFRRVVAGEDVPLVWSAVGDFQEAYDVSDLGVSADAAFAAWRGEVARSRQIELAAPSLDVTAHVTRWGEDVSLRFVLLHVIHEYARHNGHADLIREGVDGTVGA